MHEELEKYKWISKPPEPWLDHFCSPLKTLYCPKCDGWKVPEDSVILWTTNTFKCAGGGYDEDKNVPIRVPIMCPDCGTELILRPDGYYGDNDWVWWRHTLVPVNVAKGISPEFLNMLAGLINAGKSVQVTFTGRAGQGKSYFMLKMAQVLDPYMSIDRMIFERDVFAHVVRTAKPKTIMCVDESSYIVGKHSWSNPDQRQTLLIWESMRYKLLPVFTTVINISLLDKTLREQLIVFQVNVLERGVANCYEIKPHPLTDYVGYEFLQTLYFPMPDWNFCKVESCLLPRCKYVEVCPLLRAQYEKKKEIIQDRRYKLAEQSMTSAKGFVRYLEEFLDVMDGCYTEIGGKMKLDREMIELQLGCSGSMAQRVRQLCSSRTKEQILDYISKYKSR